MDGSPITKPSANIPPVDCTGCKPDQSNRPGSLDPGGRPRPQRGRGRQQRITANSLTVFPTNRCNLACHYCFIYEYARERGNIDMSLKTGSRAVDWLLLQSTKPQVSFHWFGGEPLVAFGLMKKVTNYGNNKTKGTGKNIRWGLTTNLTLVNDEVNAFLKKNNYNVLCSIDGTKETHDMHRVFRGSNKGSWDQAMAGLKRVLKWNAARTIRWTVAPDTAFNIAESTRFFWDMGPKHVAQEFVYETTWTKEDLENIKGQFRLLIPDIVAKATEDVRLTCKPFEDGMRSFTLIERMNARQRCGIGNNSFGLGTRGDLYRCHRFVDQPEHKVGDVFNGINMKTASGMVRDWNVHRIVPWTRNEMTCIRCIGRMGCSAGCLAVNYDVNQSIYRPPEAYCRILRMKVELAGELRKALRDVDKLNWYTRHKQKPVY